MPNKIKYPVIDGYKECGDCGKFKTIDNYNKAKTHYTSQCHDCLKIYHKNYREKPENKLKSRKYHQEYLKKNRKKKNAYMREYQKKDYVRIKKNKERRIWASKQKIQSLEYLGGKCYICGYNKCLAALDFHHKDPTTKIGIKQHNSFKNRQNELDKCIILCCRCHREVHAGVTKIE